MRPSYRDLMTATDATGQGRSFLATEDGFAFVKALHTRNLIVPVVGDFGGPKAIRETGAYVRRHGGRVQAFYGSNVGVYLSTARRSRSAAISRRCRRCRSRGSSTARACVRSKPSCAPAVRPSADGVVIGRTHPVR